MAVHIRLARAGAKKAPFYRIVVTNSRSPRDGRFIENLGTFDPSRDASFRINQERLEHWTKVGAQPSPTVRQLLKRFVKAKPAA
ncbi:MAG: 30S ribosomal protein S16 [Polyangiaceae bacterium]|nr:30S ribosomal protein S16 [Polyangiaceae bacterium]